MKMVEEAEAVDGMGELVLNLLNAGSSSSLGGVLRLGCSPLTPSIKLKKRLVSQPIMNISNIENFNYEIKGNNEWKR